MLISVVFQQISMFDKRNKSHRNRQMVRSVKMGKKLTIKSHFQEIENEFAYPQISTINVFN